MISRFLIEHIQIAEGLAKESIDFCEKNLFCDADATKDHVHTFDAKKITENTKLLCINNIHNLSNDIENCLKKILPTPIPSEKF